MTKPRILYVLDDPHYPSGARQATAVQIRTLQPYCDISIFSPVVPSPAVQQFFGDVEFVSSDALWPTQCLNQTLPGVLLGGGYTLVQRSLKLRQAFAILTGELSHFYTRLYHPYLAEEWEHYDFVICVSEASKFRELISSLRHPQKIQWIHTDYARWHNNNNWTRGVSRRDETLYARYDHVVTLSESCRQDMLTLYPSLEKKILAIRNLVDVDAIRQKGLAPSTWQMRPGCVNLISVGRLEPEKNIPWILDIALHLKRQGCAFHWYIVGGGRLWEKLLRQVYRQALEDCVTLTGPLDNPLPLVRQADVFVLVSQYEGTPATLDEAQVLGVPALVTAVGGVPEQMKAGHGLLMKPTRESCLAQVSRWVQKAQLLPKCGESSSAYISPNEETMHRLFHLLQLDL